MLPRLLLTAVLILAGARAAGADIRPDSRVKPPVQPKTYRVEIAPAANGAGPTLEVPRGLLAENPAGDGSAPLRSALAGALLSLGIAGGGLWAARRRGHGVPASLALALVTIGAGFAGGAAYANIAPFPRPTSAVRVRLIGTTSDTIRLVVDQRQFSDLQAEYNRRTPRLNVGSRAPGSAPR